jgi:hypothetical protein
VADGENGPAGRPVAEHSEDVPKANFLLEHGDGKDAIPHRSYRRAVEACRTIFTRGQAGRTPSADYWLSTEVLSGPEVASILTNVLGRPIRCDIKGPDDLKALLLHPDSPMERNYAEAVLEFMRQVIDGRMGYVGTLRDDAPFVTGRHSTSFHQWATENRETLLRIANIAYPNSALLATA